MEYKKLIAELLLLLLQLLLMLMMFGWSHKLCVSVCVAVDCSEFIYLLLGFQNIQLHLCCCFNVFACCLLALLRSFCVLKYNILYYHIHNINHFVRSLVNRLEQVDALHILLFLILSVSFLLSLLVPKHTLTHTNFYDNDCNKSSYVNITRHF